MPDNVSPELVRRFAESMPAGYQDRYAASVIARHAELSASRPEGSVVVGTFEDDRSGGRGVCVVADDEPGLLANISAAFLLADVDVTAAEAFTRALDSGKKEAVDLFWLRRIEDDQGVGGEELERVRDLLLALLGGDSERREQAERRSTPPRRERQADATVRFLDDSSGALATLEVETTDRSGLLHVLSSALFQQRVQIVRSEVRTEADRVLDRFSIVEFDGSPISAARRLEIQVAVLNAIEPARRSAPPPAETQL